MRGTVPYALSRSEKKLLPSVWNKRVKFNFGPCADIQEWMGLLRRAHFRSLERIAGSDNSMALEMVTQKPYGKIYSAPLVEMEQLFSLEEAFPNCAQTP